MKIHTLTTTDAFIAFEYDDVPSVGITRRARKVLPDGAKLLARSTTYSFASFGIRMAGGSAGINAEDDAKDTAVGKFVEEVADLVSSGRWATDPGLGLTESDLGPLRIGDSRPSELWNDSTIIDLTARGAVAAAAALRDLDGASCAVVGKGPLVTAVSAAIAAADAQLVGDSVDADCDVLFVAGKAGVLDHDAAATVRAKVVVPLTPVPVTARAHAVLSQADCIHVPDFLSTAAPLLAAHGPSSVDPVWSVGESVKALADEGTGLWMAAVTRAEAFLQEWQGELPFGRPLA